MSGELVVLAAEGDAAAAAFVERHREHGARLLRPADLSCPGWRYRVGDIDGSVAMIDGRPCAAGGLRAVVTRLASVEPAQLPHVADDDRDYVAAELNAFLIAWLGALRCPVLNRPVAPSIAGPAWSWMHWARCAATLGIPVVEARREVRGDRGTVPGGDPPDRTREPSRALRFDVIGAAVLGPDRPGLAARARALARAAGVALLGLRFDDGLTGSPLAGIDPWPDLADPAIAAAVLGEVAR